GDLNQMLFSVFPNPANDVLNFQAEVPLKNVNIYNNVGQLIFSQNLRNTFESIMVSELHSGVYIAQLETDYGVKTLKFVKR
ncbi:MAG: T9SS type A sorting domain-containing protein, partial [Flavobacterium sp.]|nr:T9SS type A sorting domain-containing protein [Flavobacterium sp.]